jgi:hypothetical protein
MLKYANYNNAMPKTQTLNCRRFSAVYSTSLSADFNKQADLSNKPQVIRRINALDSNNRPACPPIIASVELTNHSWNVLQHFE